MNTRQIALISMMSAASIVIAYSKGLAIPSLPGVVEFMTVLVFVSGFCFGWLVGTTVGVVTLTIYMLIPYPFAHPGAWLFSTSPILLAVMAALGGMFGFAGAASSKLMRPRKTRRFALTLAFLGLGLTFMYDIVSSVGFALAYPAFTTVWHAVVLTFVPLYYPWPPIIHTLTNSIIFATVAPALITTIRALPGTMDLSASKKSVAHRPPDGESIYRP